MRNTRRTIVFARLAALALLVVAVAYGATASGAPTKSAAKGGGEVTLNYWDMQWGGPAFMNQIKKNVAEFNRTHPGIEVKFTELSWGDYMQKILSAVQAGTPPDVSGGDAGIAFNMNAQGAALPIGDLCAKWRREGRFKDMKAFAYEKWLLAGRPVGITWQFDSRFIYYRKDLFRQAGVKVPTTWDQWLAAAKKLHNPRKGILGIAVPGKQGSYDTDQFYMTLVLQAGGYIANKQGRPAFDTPAQLKALTFEQQLVKCCAHKGTAAWTFTEVQRAYTQGKAAMAFGGGWFLGSIRDAKIKNLYRNTGILPVLTGPGGPKARHSVAFANPWMIYRKTKHPREAKVFLDWMMRKQNLKKLYAADPGGKWPVYNSLLRDPIFKRNPLIRDAANQVVKYGVDYWYPYNKAAVAIGSMGTSIADVIVNPVLSGKRTPAQALRDAQKKLAPLFKTKR